MAKFADRLRQLESSRQLGSSFPKSPVGGKNTPVGGQFAKFADKIRQTPPKANSSEGLNVEDTAMSPNREVYKLLEQEAGGYRELNVNDEVGTMEETSWYQVVQSKAHIKASPNTMAAEIGLLPHGTKIQTKAKQLQDERGGSWVQLTEAQVISSCPTAGDNIQGYCLLDSRHIGGVLLLQPWMPESHDWFEVVKSIVFVKGSPSKDSASLGCVRQGQRLKCKKKAVTGEDGYTQWVELTPDQMERVEGADPKSRGFCLIDGNYVNLGILLRGPLPPPTRAEEALWRANEDAAIRSWNEDRSKDLQEFRTKQQGITKQKKHETQKNALLEAMERWKEDAEHEENREESLRMKSGIVTYRAVHEGLFQRQIGGDIVQRPCRPGCCVFTTGDKWTGPQGGEWVQSAKKASTWYLVQGPGFGVEGPLLLNEADAVDHVQVSISYSSPVGEFRVLDTFIPESTSVRALKNMISEHTKLKSRGIGLLKQSAKRGADVSALFLHQDMPDFAIVRAEPELLVENQSLKSCDVGSKVQLHLVYSYDFSADFQGGI